LTGKARIASKINKSLIKDKRSYFAISYEIIVKQLRQPRAFFRKYCRLREIEYQSAAMQSMHIHP